MYVYVTQDLANADFAQVSEIFDTVYLKTL